MTGLYSCRSSITANFNKELSGVGSTETPTSGEAPAVNSVRLEDDQLIVEGFNLSDPSEVKINSDILSVVSSTAERIVLTSTSKVTFALGTALNLTVTTASGSSTVSVQFNLVDGSVTTAKIADASITSSKLNLTAGNGQFLQYSGGGVVLNSTTARVVLRFDLSTTTIGGYGQVETGYSRIDANITQIGCR